MSSEDDIMKLQILECKIGHAIEDLENSILFQGHEEYADYSSRLEALAVDYRMLLRKVNSDVD